MKVIAVTLLFLLAVACTSAQSSVTEKRNDAMAQNVISWLNNKAVGKIYAAFDSTMKKAISKDVFFSMTETHIYPLLPFAVNRYTGMNGTLNSYLLKTAADPWSMQVSVNQQNEINGILLAPAKKQKLVAAAHTNTTWHDNALLTTLDSLVHKIAFAKMQETNTPGMSIGVLQGLKGYYYNYGLANITQSTHPLKTTVFEIGSVSKTFTAFILADAVMNSRASLDDPITQYLPASVATNKDLQAITLLHLANHTSGLPRLPTNAFDGATNMLDPYVAYDTAKLMKYLQGYKATTHPGYEYSYSNLGYGLLGTILEKIYQKPLEELYQQIIFKPFKMNNSYAGPIKDSSMTAAGYNTNGDETSYWNFGSMKGAGAIKSTTEDLLKYALQFTLKPRVKGNPDARIDLLETITYNQNGTVVSLGWHFKNPFKANQVMNHNGGTGGFRSEIDINAREKMAVVVLSNSGKEENASIAASEIMAQLLAAKAD